MENTANVNIFLLRLTISYTFCVGKNDHFILLNLDQPKKPYMAKFEKTRERLIWGN